MAIYINKKTGKRIEWSDFSPLNSFWERETPIEDEFLIDDDEDEETEVEEEEEPVNNVFTEYKELVVNADKEEIAWTEKGRAYAYNGVHWERFKEAEEKDLTVKTEEEKQTKEKFNWNEKGEE